jgi:hypothetical protein
VHRDQFEGGAADPVGQGRAIELDALAGIDLRLAVKRQMVGVLGDDHLRHQRLGRQAALDQPLRRRHLGDLALAGAAGILEPPRDDHLELRRHHVQPLRGVLADADLQPAAAGAALVGDVEHHLFAR